MASGDDVSLLWDASEDPTLSEQTLTNLVRARYEAAGKPTSDLALWGMYTFAGGACAHAVYPRCVPCYTGCSAAVRPPQTLAVPGYGRPCIYPRAEPLLCACLARLCQMWSSHSTRMRRKTQWGLSTRRV